MDIKEFSKSILKLDEKDIKIISEKSLFKFFNIYDIEKDNFCVPKKDYIYFIKSGRALSNIFIDDLEINLKFNEGEYITFLNHFDNENYDFMISGLPKTKVVEIPISKLLDISDSGLKIKIHEIISKILTNNFFKVLSLHASSINLTNEQYFIKFLISNGGVFTCTSSFKIAQILNVNPRTLQRTIKNLIDQKVIKKVKKTLILINKNKYIKELN